MIIFHFEIVITNFHSITSEETQRGTSNLTTENYDQTEVLTAERQKKERLFKALQPQVARQLISKRRAKHNETNILDHEILGWQHTTTSPWITETRNPWPGMNETAMHGSWREYLKYMSHQIIQLTYFFTIYECSIYTKIMKKCDISSPRTRFLHQEIN